MTRRLPTHCSATGWGQRRSCRYPAKGRGELARRIVEIAGENDVTIEANGPLAEALAGVELDEEIPIELYQAAAEIIGFVLRATRARQ